LSSSTVSDIPALAALENVPGLVQAKRVVRRIAEGSSGVHAVMFYGAPGSGADLAADTLAKVWLAKDPSDPADRAVAAFDRGSAADFLEIRPGGLSSIITTPMLMEVKGTDFTGIPLQTFFRTMPLMAKHKVAIIRNAHRMNASSANSLLKTLEEPHPFAKLILTVPSVGEVLPTILSRCVAVNCELPAPEDLRALFPTATDVDIRLSEGAPGRLAEIMANPEPYRAVATFAEGLKGRGPQHVLKLSEQFSELAEGFKTKDGTVRAANTEALDVLAIWLARSPDADPRWTQAVIEAHRRIVQNGNAGVVFDAMFARMLV